MGLCSNKTQLNPNNLQASVRPNVFHPQESMSEIMPLDLRCRGAFPIALMCINNTCQCDALFCEDNTCTFCTKKHQICGQIKLQSLLSLIREKQRQQGQFLMQIDQIEANLFHNILKRRQIYLQNILKKGFDNKYSIIANNLFFDGVNSHFRGRQAEQFYQKLKKSVSSIKKYQRSILHSFRYEVQDVAVRLRQLQGKVIQKYIDMFKVQVQKNKSLSLIPSPYQFTIDTKIIPPQMEQDIQFIYQSLDWPKQLKLIFRASENGFSAAKFHQKCDNTPHTLTLIRTEYDHIIAGYTPIVWNLTEGIAPDYTGMSFLLSINLKEKMTLTYHEKAIQCDNQYGPVFGGGSDLGITDLCNENRQSWTNFPYSYNCIGKYRYNQHAWKALCGVENGKKFKVLQYEVYKVSWLL